MILKIKYLFSILIVAVSISSCNTGIEKTKTIRYSRTDRLITERTPEESLMDPIAAPLLSLWRKGREFVIADNRAMLIFDNEAVNDETADSIAGHHIYFETVDARITPGGQKQAYIIFRDLDGKMWNYPTGKRPDQASSSISATDLPMLIDVESVNRIDSIMRGRKVWTKSQLWYDTEGERFKGKKFVPVTIENVSIGNMVFPAIIHMLDEKGSESIQYMSIRNTGLESRTFADLFLLSDPRLKYKNISDEVWSLIQDGNLKKGMTKDECKLSVGNPADVSSGHDWSQTIDIWNYPDGKYLQFQDGLLINFRI